VLDGSLKIFAHQQLITLFVFVARLTRSFQVELGERAVGGIERASALTVDQPKALIQSDPLQRLLKGIRKDSHGRAGAQAHLLRRQGRGKK